MPSAGTQRESWNQPGEAGLSPQSGCATRRRGGTAGKPSTTTGAQRAPPWGCPWLGLHTGDTWAGPFPRLGSWVTLPPRAQSTESNSMGSVKPGASKSLGPLTAQVTGASVAEEDGNIGFEPLRRPFQSASTFSLPGAPAQPLDPNKTAVSAGRSSLA